MKKLIISGIICFIGSVLLSSCGTNSSITKRHYNKGYYVTTDNKTNTSHLSKPIHQNRENNQTEAKVSEPGLENTQIDNNVKSKVIANNTSQATEEQKKSKTIASENKLKSTIKNSKTILENPAQKFKQALLKTQKTSNTTSSEGVLSLLWIVIVIVLILWALGLVVGIGPYVHLLLVVALILLILWLLHII